MVPDSEPCRTPTPGARNAISPPRLAGGGPVSIGLSIEIPRVLFSFTAPLRSLMPYSWDDATTPGNFTERRVRQATHIRLVCFPGDGIASRLCASLDSRSFFPLSGSAGRLATFWSGLFNLRVSVPVFFVCLRDSLRTTQEKIPRRPEEGPTLKSGIDDVPV